MNRILLPTIAAVVALLAAQRLPAQESHAPHAPGPQHGAAAATQAAGHDRSHGGDAHGAPDAHDAGPVPPADHRAVWPGVVLILIATMFVLAAVIGPIARMHAPPAEMPATHSHDEPPGASHHHGSGGTINPEPYHGHASDHGHGGDHEHH